MFVGFLVRSQVTSLLEDGTITERQVVNIPGTSRRKSINLFKLLKVMVCIIYSNAEEISVFSRIRKSLRPQCVSILNKVTFLVGRGEGGGRRAAWLCAQILVETA